MNAAGQAGLWNAAQLRLFAGLNIAALGALVVAWRGSDRTTALDHQVGWLNLAVLGVVLAAGTDILLVTTGRRRVMGRRRRLLVDVVPPAAQAARHDRAEGWVHVAGTVRVHHRGCLLITGRAADPIEPPVARANGLRRCELCAVDERSQS